VNKEPFDYLAVDGVEIKLQKFPHIAHKIVQLWGTMECINYINQVLSDLDRGTRIEPSQGFPMETMEELLYLLEKHPPVYELKKKPSYPHVRWTVTDHAPFI
jgi:hypothetical protein